MLVRNPAEVGGHRQTGLRALGSELFVPEVRTHARAPGCMPRGWGLWCDLAPFALGAAQSGERRRGCVGCNERSVQRPRRRSASCAVRSRSLPALSGPRPGLRGTGAKSRPEAPESPDGLRVHGAVARLTVRINVACRFRCSLTLWARPASLAGPPAPASRGGDHSGPRAPQEPGGSSEPLFHNRPERGFSNSIRRPGLTRLVCTFMNC